MMLVYVGLALFEEGHLTGVYGNSWNGYSAKVGFFIPLLVCRDRVLEVVAAIVVLSGLMACVVLYGRLVLPT